MVLRSTVSMFGPLQPGWLSTARASFRNDARRTRPSGRVTAEQQAAPTDSADQLGLVLNSWLALAHAMHAVQAFLARRTLVTLKKIKRLKIIPAIIICGFPGPRRIIQKAPQLANVEEAPAQGSCSVGYRSGKPREITTSDTSRLPGWGVWTLQDHRTPTRIST